MRQLRPGERITRLQNMAWLVTGIYQSKSVHLSKIALKIPGVAKLRSTVRRLIPADIPVSLVGDSEFGAVDVIRQLETWGWRYVLRRKANHRVKLSDEEDWQHFGDLIQRPDQGIWLERSLLTFKHAYPVNLLAHWKRGEKET